MKHFADRVIDYLQTKQTDQIIESIKKLNNMKPSELHKFNAEVDSSIESLVNAYYLNWFVTTFKLEKNCDALTNILRWKVMESAPNVWIQIQYQVGDCIQVEICRPTCKVCNVSYYDDGWRKLYNHTDHGRNFEAYIGQMSSYYNYEATKRLIVVHEFARKLVNTIHEINLQT